MTLLLTTEIEYATIGPIIGAVLVSTVVIGGCPLRVKQLQWPISSMPFTMQAIIYATSSHVVEHQFIV